MDTDTEVDRLRAVIRAQTRRLDYAVLQLEREAKFLPESNPENRRFHRAYSTVKEVRDSMSQAAEIRSSGGGSWNNG